MHPPRRLERLRRLAAALALLGWSATFASQLAVLRAADEAERDAREGRRDRFLLLSSLATNTLVFVSVYLYARSWWDRRTGRSRS